MRHPRSHALTRTIPSLHAGVRGFSFALLQQCNTPAEIGTAQRSINVYFVIANGQQACLCECKEEALVEAAQLDFMHNSPELNNGVQGTVGIQILSFAEMMESSIEMVL